MAASAVVSGYLILSLSLSIFHIVRSRAQKSRILLVFFDTVNFIDTKLMCSSMNTIFVSLSIA